MSKGNLIRAGILFSLFVIILGAAWGCSYVKDKNVTPEITNKDGIYLSVGDVDVTNQELWDQMRLSDGLSYLEKYIEEKFLFTAEIVEVDPDEIDEKIEYYKFGTNDPEELAIIDEDQELKDTLLQQFEESLLILGYDPLNADDLKAFVELEVAKENAVRAYIDSAEGEDSLAIEEDDLEVYYNATVIGDISGINIIFSSENEAEAVFEKFNLVPDYNLGWGSYTGDDYSATKTADAWDDTNTTPLTDEQVLTKFIQMYNYMNPNDTQLPPAATTSNFETLSGDDFMFSYNDMTEGRATNDPYAELADYLFFTLNLEDDYARYSFMLQEFGDFQVLSYKVGQDDVPTFASLNATELEALREELLDEKVNASNYATVVSNIWDAAEYEIFDPIFKLQNVYNGNEEFSNSGDGSVVATINGNDITADMLYNYMKDSIGVYYSIEIVKTELLLSSEAYADIYGDDYDYMNSDLEAIVAHQDDLRGMKTSFGSDEYSTYGFSSQTYSWDEFLLLAFNALTEADVIKNIFVVPAVSPYFTIDTVDFEAAADVMDQKYEDYFSLDVNHLLFYVDADKDLSLDGYNDFYETLEGADLVEYNAKVSALRALVLSKVADEYTFDEMVAEFNDGLLDDPDNDWAEYKAYGFLIMTQDLSADGSLDPTTTENYDPAFVTATKELYDRYVILNNVNANGVGELYDDTLVKSDFGLHFLYATQGSDFEMPTAVYNESEDTDSAYPVEANNTTVLPSLAQAELYIQIKFATAVGEATDATLPTSVYNAVDYFFGDTYAAYFTSTAYSIETINHMLDNTVTFEADAASSVKYLEDILGVLYNNNFPEGFIVSE